MSQPVTGTLRKKAIQVCQKWVSKHLDSTATSLGRRIPRLGLRRSTAPSAPARASYLQRYRNLQAQRAGRPVAITTAAAANWFTSKPATPVPDTPVSERSVAKDAVFSMELLLKLYDDILIYCAQGDLDSLKDLGAEKIKQVVLAVQANPLAPLETTPLHAAAANEQLDVLSFLIDNDIMPLDATLRPSTFTALHFAIGHRHAEAAILLLKAGASIDALTPKGLNALQLAWRFAEPSVVACIRDIQAHQAANPSEPKKGSKRDYVKNKAGYWDEQDLTFRPKIYAPNAEMDVTGQTNPLPVPILDLTPIALTYISSTGDEKVAESFSNSRNWDGRKLHEVSLPTLYNVGKETQGTLAYKLPQSIRWWTTQSYQGPMYKAKVMEEKWDIYRYDDELHFTRSWTQTLVYRAKMKVTADAPLEDEAPGGNGDKTGPQKAIAAFQILSIQTSRNDISAPEAAAEVDFLIKRLLMGLVVPAPVPMYDLRDPKQVEKFWLTSFSLWGRAGLFGAFTPTYPKLFGNMDSIVRS